MPRGMLYAHVYIEPADGSRDCRNIYTLYIQGVRYGEASGLWEREVVEVWVGFTAVLTLIIRQS